MWDWQQELFYGFRWLWFLMRGMKKEEERWRESLMISKRERWEERGERESDGFREREPNLFACLTFERERKRCNLS